MLHEKGMSDAVMALHGMNAPPTTDFGSSVIDGLWVSPTLQPSEAGYLACGEAVPRTDHRCLWFDISYQNMYGHILPALPTFRARRLKLNDPRVVKKFNDAYEKFISTNKLDQRPFALQQRCTYPMSQEMKDDDDPREARHHQHQRRSQCQHGHQTNNLERCYSFRRVGTAVDLQRDGRQGLPKCSRNKNQ